MYCCHFIEAQASSLLSDFLLTMLEHGKSIMRLSHLGLVLSAIALSLAFSVANANPRTFTLDCANGKAAPSGVPSTLTNWSNTQVFRAWCDAAGTDTLVIEMSHTADLRMLESTDGPSSSNSSNLSGWMPGGPDLPDLVYRVRRYNGTVGNIEYGVLTYYDRATDDLEYDWYDASWNYVSQGSTPSVSQWIEMAKFFIGWDFRYSKAVSYRITPKKTCPAHHDYLFINTLTGEAVGNFIHGGSCYHETVTRGLSEFIDARLSD